MISASACEKAEGCLRKWFLDRDLPYEEGEAAKLGHDVHDVAEAYHKQGKKPDEETRAGAVFMPALPYLPAPLTGRAEGKFSFRVGKVEFIGYMDLTLESARLLPTQRQPVPEKFLDWPVVLDYKSTKNPRKTMIEGPGEFLTNKQTVLYAYKVLLDYPQAEGVFLRWVYLRTGQTENPEGEGYWNPKKTPKAYVSDCGLSRVEILDAFKRLILPLAGGLVTIRRAAKFINPMSLPFNAEQCYKYGKKYPCAHVGTCQLTASQMFEGRQEYNMDDLLAQLEAEVAMTKGVNPPEGKKNTPPAVEEDEEAALERKLAEAKAAKAEKARLAEEAAKARAATLGAIATSEKKAVDQLTDAELGAMVRALFRAVK